MDQIRRFATTSYSIDISPQVREKLSVRMPNVEFLTGNSAELIADALNRCEKRGQPLGFVLIDGDHSYAGVQGDIHALLKFRPSRDVWVLMHDSFNPECRRGIAAANWSGSPYVHCVELDFIHGGISDDPEFPGQMWGGLAIALLRPNPRLHSLEIEFSGKSTFNALYRTSWHPPTLHNMLRRWAHTKRKGLARRFGKRE